MDCKMSMTINQRMDNRESIAELRSLVIELKKQQTNKLVSRNCRCDRDNMIKQIIELIMQKYETRRKIKELYFDKV